MKVFTIFAIIWIAAFTVFYFRNNRKQVSCESGIGEKKMDKRIVLFGIGFMLFIYILTWILVKYV